MNKTMDDGLAQYASLYDFFYYDYRIAMLLSDFGAIKEFFERENSNIEDIYLGYLYLIELVLMHIVNHVEGLITNFSLREFVEWGEISLENKEVIEIIKQYEEGKYILELLSVRKKLSKLRFSNKFEENTIRRSLKNLSSILEELNSYLIEQYDVKRVSQKEEKMLIINWILNNYNYIESSPNEDLDEYQEIPLWPGNPGFFLMPNSLRKNYLLENPKIKEFEKQYLRGYTLSLLYLYEKVGFQADEIKDVKSWEQLHKLGAKLFKKITVSKEEWFLKRLFDVKGYPEDEILERGGKIENFITLKAVLRGRMLRVLENRFSGDYPTTEAAFNHFLHGALMLYYKDLRDKPTVIEFKEVKRDNDGWEASYSYAIDVPIVGVFWDASHWLLFHEVFRETYAEPVDFARLRYLKQLLSLAESGDILFLQYELEDNLLERYMNEMDIHLKKERLCRDKVEIAKGLVGELIGTIYLIKKYRNDVKILDIHKYIKIQEGSTDIDVLGEINGEMVIVEAKTKISTDEGDISNILEHFNRALQHLPAPKRKKAKKVLLVKDIEIGEDTWKEFLKPVECKILDEEGKVIEKSAGYNGFISREDEEKLKKRTIKIFENNGIEVVLLHDFINPLKESSEYYDLGCKIEKIYNEPSDLELLTNIKIV